VDDRDFPMYSDLIRFAEGIQVLTDIDVQEILKNTSGVDEPIKVDDRLWVTGDFKTDDQNTFWGSISFSFNFTINL
jgi:hypothetical protein